jgi:hypothetical protein
MAKGYYTLADQRDPIVRLYCPDCHRFAQFRRAGLIECFGADQPCQICWQSCGRAIGRTT